MSEYNVKSAVVRTNTNHGIRCPAGEERKLVTGLNELFENNSFSKQKLDTLVSDLPVSFFSDNGFDSPAQYSRLLFDALTTSDLKPASQSSVSHVTNFNGPVQTQILQTGPTSKAKVVQTSQQNQLYSKMLMSKLEKVEEAVVQDIPVADQKSALAIVEQAKAEAAKPEAKPGKVKKILSALGKWSGERLTKAVDAAVSCGINYGIKGHP